MGILNSERPPDKWSPAYFRMFVEKVRTALNFIDKGNFPNGLDGSVILPSTLRTSAINWQGLTINKDFFADGEGVVVTTERNLGSGVLFNPSWLNIADVFFECTAAMSASSRIGTVTLEGVNGEIASIEVNTTQLTRYEIPIPKGSLPLVPGTLICKGVAANVAYPLTILSARIILSIR